MRIRRKRKTENDPNKKRKGILDRRIKLPNNVRLGVIGIIFIFLIFSFYTAQAIDEEPELIIKSKKIYDYSQNGNYDYTIFLTDNLVYDGRKTIKPQDNLIIFRNIVDHIEASFTYTFYSSMNASVTGEYKLIATIQTDLWSKDFPLLSGKFTDTFNEKFPIDYLYYENVTARINEETQVTATNPVLTIKCNVLNLEIESDEEQFDLDHFSPSISITLNENTIDFIGNLKNQISDVKTDQERTYSTKDSKEKEQWTANSYIFIIIIIIFSLVTRGDAKKLNEIEKQVKKINKKYNEWIVEVDSPPKRPLGTEIINIKSLEDLMKISEELGKPVMFHESDLDGTYSYYVLDETVHYKFMIYDKERFIEKLVKDKEKFRPNF